MKEIFINRTKELQRLNKCYDSDNFEFAVIWGRRRIGKTLLINKSIENRNCITCTGLKTSIENNIANMTDSFLSVLMPNISHPSFNSYKELFDFLNHNDKFLSSDYIIVLDEYPLLAGNKDELSSVLQYSIDKYWKNTKLKLVLCGSSVSFMKEQVLSGDSPLYGRTTLIMEVKKFMLWEMKAYNWSFTIEETAILYSALGGIPRYLNMVDDSISVKENLYNLFFNTGSILAGETDTLLNEEFKETARYSDVLSAIASGRSSLNDIAEKVRMQTGTVSFYLSNMIRVGLIKKETPYGSSNNKKSIYTITDGLFRFHYQFVIPNINMINFGKGKDILDMVVIPSLSRYMGLEWEQICISYMFASFNVTRDPFLYNDLQRWWGGSSKLKKQIEIDMMSTQNDKALFGECKWTNDKVDISILDNLIDKCSHFDYKSKTWYLFSKSGFEESLIEKANKESNIQLISLNDVYSL